MMGMAVSQHQISLVYGQGLQRTYNAYVGDGARARTENDIRLKSGDLLYVEIDDGYLFAIGAWDDSTKSNLVYGGWKNPTHVFYPQKDVLVKVVIRNSSNTTIATDSIPQNALRIYVYRCIAHEQYGNI